METLKQPVTNLAKPSVEVLLQVPLKLIILFKLTLLSPVMPLTLWIHFSRFLNSNPQKRSP